MPPPILRELEQGLRFSRGHMLHYRFSFLRVRKIECFYESTGDKLNRREVPNLMPRTHREITALLGSLAHGRPQTCGLLAFTIYLKQPENFQAHLFLSGKALKGDACCRFGCRIRQIGLKWALDAYRIYATRRPTVFEAGASYQEVLNTGLQGLLR